MDYPLIQEYQYFAQGVSEPDTRYVQDWSLRRVNLDFLGRLPWYSPNVKLAIQHF